VNNPEIAQLLRIALLDQGIYVPIKALLKAVNEVMPE